MKYAVLIFTSLAFVILTEVTDLHAQWKKIAQSLVKPVQLNPPSFGAIHYKDGVVWAGWKDLWRSPDTGATWQKRTITMPSSATITDINFYDKLNGLVATLNDGIFLTRDGGESWKQILSVKQCTNAAFNKSPDIIHVLTSGDSPTPTGFFHTSIDGGATWTLSWPGGEFCECFTIAKNGTIYVVCSADAIAGFPGFISASTDLGKTWKQSSGQIEGDSYSICADSADAKKLYVANEDYTGSVNGYSDLYYSVDAGNSWISSISFRRPYLTGAMTCSAHTIYSSTLSNGILRSTDKGKTWQSTYSPPDELICAYDSRNIACATDNIVFVLDATGNIWKTTNGGGDSVTGKVGVRSSSLIKNNSLAASVYPNPSNGQVRIEFKLPEGVLTGEIVIADALGNGIKRFRVGNVLTDVLIDESDLASGSYFYKLVTDIGESEARKFLIIK